MNVPIAELRPAGSIDEYETATWRRVETFGRGGHDELVLGLAASLDGKWLVSTSSDSTAIIWDRATRTRTGCDGSD